MKRLILAVLSIAVVILSQAEVKAEQLSPEATEILAKCVESEAGNQGLMGKRFVVDVILNRVDSERFPNDVTSVISQKGQFSVVSSGVIYKTEPSEETYEAIKLEMEHRTDKQILFFASGSYNKFSIPAYQHGDHFFGY